MAEKIRMFWSPETEAQYVAAYDAVMQRWPVAYDELCIPTRFGETHVIASGAKDAAPLVLLNPAGGSAAIWSRNIQAFSQRFRTYAVDVIGDLNKSVPTRSLHSRQDFADWIGDLFGGLQIERASIVGNSYGGYLTLNTALLLPDRVKAAVLISPAATFAPIWSLYWHQILPLGFIAPLLRSDRLARQFSSWVWAGFPMDEDYARLRALTATAGYPRYRPTHNPPPMVFSDAELRQIRTPVLLLIGDHEVIYNSARVVERATRLVPGLKAEIVPNANHAAQYTAPDFVNQKILGFLSAA